MCDTCGCGNDGSPVRITRPGEQGKEYHHHDHDHPHNHDHPHSPSLFELGEKSRIVIISVTEGEDKPLKYPTMFEHAHICIINKTDLLPYVDFDPGLVKKYALSVNPHLRIMELSAKTGEGMEQWISTLLDMRV